MLHDIGHLFEQHKNGALNNEEYLKALAEHAERSHYIDTAEKAHRKAVGIVRTLEEQLKSAKLEEEIARCHVDAARTDRLETLRWDYND